MPGGTRRRELPKESPKERKEKEEVDKGNDLDAKEAELVALLGYAEDTANAVIAKTVTKNDPTVVSVSLGLVPCHKLTHGDVELVHGEETYWESRELPHAAPALGLVRGNLYSAAQRVAVLQFTLFNIVITQNKNRFFARRTSETHLWFPIGEAPVYRSDDVILPALAARGQVFDLIPTSAYHGEQVGTRCHRPESAISAAAKNRAARDAKLLAETQRTITSPPTAFTHFLTANLPEAFYLTNPLRFDLAGEEVKTGASSMADAPAPGAARPKVPDVQVFPAGSASTLSSDLTTPDDPFPGIDGRDPRLIRLLAVSKEDEDWRCACGTPNCSSPACVRNPRAEIQSRSALGDPGDWYCDHCGLCNWTRRAFCLRCCPLHADNIEEAITKGLVHPDDPIIGILGYAEKKGRALRKTKNASHCACFGPHHGTRCPKPMCGVPDTLWGLYVESQGLLAAPEKRECTAQRNLSARTRRR